METTLPNPTSNPPARMKSNDTPLHPIHCLPAIQSYPSAHQNRFCPANYIYPAYKQINMDEATKRGGIIVEN